MDLGISGRTAIVCASSKGLGRGCAQALAEAGCTVVINGRDGTTLEETARQIRSSTGATVIPVVADVSTQAGQDALLAAAPEPDILVNNNGGPPPKGFRDVSREALLEGVVQNMATPLELVQRVVDGMIARRFGRIVNITSASVLTPCPGSTSPRRHAPGSPPSSPAWRARSPMPMSRSTTSCRACSTPTG